MAAAELGPPLITLDSSGLFALLNRRDPDHKGAVLALESAERPFLVPAAILAEIGYLVEQRLGAQVVDAFLRDLESGAFSVECGDEDIRRIRELITRYADLPLGVADAAVIACAERNGGSVLALDRDFHVVAKEGRIRVAP